MMNVRKWTIVLELAKLLHRTPTGLIVVAIIFLAISTSAPRIAEPEYAASGVVQKTADLEVNSDSSGTTVVLLDSGGYIPVERVEAEPGAKISVYRAPLVGLSDTEKVDTDVLLTITILSFLGAFIIGMVFLAVGGVFFGKAKGAIKKQIHLAKDASSN